VGAVEQESRADNPWGRSDGSSPQRAGVCAVNITGIAVPGPPANDAAGGRIAVCAQRGQDRSQTDENPKSELGRTGPGWNEVRSKLRRPLDHIFSLSYLLAEKTATSPCVTLLSPPAKSLSVVLRFEFTCTAGWPEHSTVYF